jgi:hypothetical protein
MRNVPYDPAADFTPDCARRQRAAVAYRCE